MKKMFVLLLGAMLFLPACLDDPIEVPETLNAWLVFYNNLMEADKVVWEVADNTPPPEQAYGFPVESTAELEGYSHQVRITASMVDGGTELESMDYLLDPFRYYMISISGIEGETQLVVDTMDTSFPTLGLVKMRFLQSSESMGDVDIYVGGELPEHRKLVGVGYGQLSPYVEASQESFWNAIIVTPADIVPADSTILSFTINNNFIPNKTYFGIFNHTEADPESSFRMQVFNQPSF